jgi:GNAT superfamily N-acetyltransferase
LQLPFDPAEIEYAPLSASCPRTAFSCDDDIVDRWFHEKALEHHQHHCNVQVAMAPGDPAPVAFYATNFQVSQLNRKILNLIGMVDQFPSFHLDWLGVRSEFQGDGLGEIVMGRVFDDFLRAYELGRVPAMTLIPATKRSRDFYLRLGFVDLIPSQPMKKMVLPARDFFAAVPLAAFDVDGP